MKKPACRKAAGFASVGSSASSKETTPASTVMTIRAELGLPACAVCLMEPTLLWLRPRVGAKPNHGFFGCQHLVAKNPAARRRHWRDACAAVVAKRRRARRATTCVPCRAFCGKCFFHALSCTTRCDGVLRSRARAMPRRDCGAPPRAPHACEKKDSQPAVFSRRTRAKCAELRKLRAPRRCTPGVRGTRDWMRERSKNTAPTCVPAMRTGRRASPPHPANETGRTVAAGRGRRAGKLSGRRLPAVRRSRPGRAVRSPARAPRLPPRTASRRRRRLR